jgi:predicted nucleic-acid-binding protein
VKGIDSNVLVRYLIKDDPAQWRMASDWLQQTKAAGESCFINNVVLCEVVWVLARAYRCTRDEVIATLERILRTSLFEFENVDAAWWALRQMKTSQADFSDCLIARINQLAGCADTATFDKGTNGVAGFCLLS